MDENIKFTMECPCLDIHIYIKKHLNKNRYLSQKKETLLYLDFRSCHHAKENIPFNVAGWCICTIVSDHIIKEQRLNELKTRLTMYVHWTCVNVNRKDVYA